MTANITIVRNFNEDFRGPDNEILKVIGSDGKERSLHLSEMIVANLISHDKNLEPKIASGERRRRGKLIDVLNLAQQKKTNVTLTMADVKTLQGVVDTYGTTLFTHRFYEALERELSTKKAK